MKKVSIYITSDGFKDGCDEISSFIHDLNDVYLEKSLFFQIAESGGSPVGGDAAFFFVRRNPADGIIDSIEAAINGKRQDSKPKIAVYFETADRQLLSEEFVRFMERLNQEAGCVYNTFAHIDTLKLGILLQLRLMYPQIMSIRLESGMVWQDRTGLLSLENMEMVVNHKELQRLTAERNELENRFSLAKARLLANPGDNRAYEAFYDASEAYNIASGAVNQIEKQLYSIIMKIYGQEPGSRLSTRQAEAYWLTECGKYAEAKQVLDFESLAAEKNRNCELLDRAAQDAVILVSEYLQLIEVNETLGDWEGADACYREAVQLEERAGLPKKTMLAYAQFLCGQNRDSDSIKIAERLLDYYANPFEPAADADKGLLYKTLGTLYDKTLRWDESESMYKAALEIYKKLAERDPAAYKPEVAKTLNELGILYWINARLTEAEEMYKASLDIWSMLSERNPAEYEMYVGKSNINLGIIYRDSRRYAQSEESYKCAIRIYEKLAESDPKTHEPIYALCCKNSAVLYSSVQRWDESEELLIRALTIFNRLAGQNPGAYEPDEAKTYAILGALYSETRQLEKAEKAHQAAAEIRRRLAARDPDSFNPYLANTYMELGVMYLYGKKMKEAEDAYRASLDLWKQVAAVNPEGYEYEIAQAYSCLGELLIEVHRQKEAEEPLITAQTILKKMAASGAPELAEPELARTYFLQGAMYKNAGHVAEAETAGRIALRIIKKYAPIHPKCKELETETLDLLSSLYDITINQLKQSLGDNDELFTSEERKIALLLIEGETQRDISRKLHITAAEVGKQIQAIREKIISKSNPDPNIAAVIVKYDLTRRETEMLRCLRHEMTNPQIAKELFLSEATIKVHVHNLLKKIGVETRQQIPAWVDSLGVEKV